MVLRGALRYVLAFMGPATAIVGAPFDDDIDSGSAYLFETGTASPGHLNCDGQINAFDIEPFRDRLFEP